MISFSAVVKRYPGGQEGLKGVSFTIAAGEFAFVAGHSGAGKSTLLKLIPAIERPSSGAILVNGQNVGTLKRSALPYLRRMATLIIDRPFGGRANVQRNLSSSELRQAIESARAEQMSASSRAELVVRLQNQLDTVLAQEMGEKRELEHEQAG